MLRRLAALLVLALLGSSPAIAACPANTGNMLTTGTDDQVSRDSLVSICNSQAGGGATLSNYSANVTTAGSGAGVGGVAIGSAGVRKLFAYQIYNGNAAVCYIQFFDQTQALTNLGTTVPIKSVGIPANGGANLASGSALITTATALTIGVTTTRNGSTACGTGLDINLDYN